MGDDMPTWNADQYMKFGDDRTQPCRDLAARVSLPDVRTVVDIGCGPGNSTQVIADRWPQAVITGVDNSASMIDAARRDHPQYRWIVSDITEWASGGGPQFDIVFSNATLHWVPDHDALYPKVLARVAPGGAFAAQSPSNLDSLAQRLMREVAPGGLRVKEWYTHPRGFYYDLLAPLSAHLDLWETEYLHILPNADAIVEWYKGTGLRPFLEALSSDVDREQFLSEYLQRIRAAYRPQADGKVLFPFRRLFVVAYSHPS
jgi:trans-aconitate 2-methyltransferase